MSVGRRVDDRLHPNIGASARLVFDNDRLAESLQPARDVPADDVRCPAGRQWHNEAYRPCRIALRPCKAGKHRQRGSARAKMQEGSTLHVQPPQQMTRRGDYTLPYSAREGQLLAPNRSANRAAECPLLEHDRKIFARSELYRFFRKSGSPLQKAARARGLKMILGYAAPSDRSAAGRHDRRGKDDRPDVH